MHVEWKLSLPLKFFLFRRDLRVSLDHNALSQELFLSAAATDILQCDLRLIDEVGSEGAETNLYKSTVEENLGVNVETGNGLLQMRHQKHVPSSVVLIMKREVIDLTEICPRSNDVDAVLEEVGAQYLHQSGRI